MPQTCKARTLNTLTRSFTVYSRVPLLHMGEVRKSESSTFPKRTKKRPGSGSNPRPLDYESNALTTRPLLLLYWPDNNQTNSFSNSRDNIPIHRFRDGHVPQQIILFRRFILFRFAKRWHVAHAVDREVWHASLLPFGEVAYCKMQIFITIRCLIVTQV